MTFSLDEFPALDYIVFINQGRSRMEDFEVIVGNIGTVYRGDSALDASLAFTHYVKASKRGEGRCADEDVTMLRGGEVTSEHFGHKHD